MKSNFKIHILVFFLSIAVLLLIYPHIFYKYFVLQMPFSDKVPQSYFADWTALISAAKCKLLGYDVFMKNPCDFWYRKHVLWDYIFIVYLTVNSLNDFYSLYLPICLNLLFLYLIISHINFYKIEQVINLYSIYF